MRIPLIPNTVKLLIILLFILIASMSYTGHVRTSMMPLPALDVEKSWFMVGSRISGLKYDRAACKATLKSPIVEKTFVNDRPIKDGCGWVNAVTLKKFAGSTIPPIKLSCPMGAGLALWMAQIVQPAAKKIFGTTVSHVSHLGGFACRNIRGSLFSKYLNLRSEHATANAIDISGFRLANGQTVSILKDWTRGGKKAEFLKEIHYGACSYFRVVLGPEANHLHANHFHFDRGLMFRCK